MDSGGGEVREALRGLLGRREDFDFYLNGKGAIVPTELYLKQCINCGRQGGMDIVTQGQVAIGTFSAEGWYHLCTFGEVNMVTRL